MNARPLENKKRGAAPMPPGIDSDAVAAIAGSLTALLADFFALYIKTKNFHWHVSGSHFRDYHLLFDEQSEELLETTDAVAEHVRKIGGVTLHSVGEIARLQRISDNDSEAVTASHMLAELCEGNSQLVAWLRGAHTLCEEHGDVASTSLIENWIDEAERRIWFLYEATRVDVESYGGPGYGLQHG
jgi:starvation-inducible DNA-binding protein